MKYLNTRKKDKYLFGLFSIFFSISIIFLSIGFASFGNETSIEGISATVRVDKDIRIKSISVKELSANVTVSYTEYNVSNTTIGLTLPNQDSYAIFDIDILNLGNVEMGLASLIGSNDDLKYEIVNNDYASNGFKPYTLTDRLCDDTDTNRCKSGAESHVLVKVSYKDNGYRVLGPNISKVVNVDNGFVIFEDDKNEDPIIIEADFLKKCLESEEVFVCDKDGYCGSTVAFEIGYLQGMGKVIKQMESFRENWLNEVINHYNNFNKKYSKKIDKII